MIIQEEEDSINLVLMDKFFDKVILQYILKYILEYIPRN